MKTDMYETAKKWIDANRRVALATVISTWGSSPRPVGSQLVINDSGAFEGSVSGGCIEGAVMAEALDVMGHGESRKLSFGVSNRQARDAGLACGGQIEIFLEKIFPEPWLDHLTDLKSSGIAFSVVTPLETGKKIVLPLDGEKMETAIDPFDTDAVRNIRYHKKNFTITVDEQSFFVHYIYPPPELIIVGAVHIAQPLSRMASMQGYNVKVIDPRWDFATQKRFPGITLMTEPVEKALKKIRLHSNCAVALLSHDLKIDLPALKAVLNSSAFYIGALGSTKTHSQRIAHLKKQGFSQNKIDRIYGPIGLDIGAITTEEIALSVLSQITRVRRLGEGRSARDKQSIQSKAA